MNKPTIANIKFTCKSIVLLIAIFGCNRQPHISYKIDSPFKKSLVEKEIKGTDYHISIPRDYLLRESRGPDFSVYYFYPSDTSDRAHFRGGFYLGNAPNGFNPDNNNCKEGKINSELLDTDQAWTLYHCNNNYQIQLITNSRSSSGWDRYIHAFGRATSKAELDKLLEVYTTLKRN